MKLNIIPQTDVTQEPECHIQEESTLQQTEQTHHSTELSVLQATNLGSVPLSECLTSKNNFILGFGNANV